MMPDQTRDRSAIEGRDIRYTERSDGYAMLYDATNPEAYIHLEQSAVVEDWP